MRLFKLWVFASGLLILGAGCNLEKNTPGTVADGGAIDGGARDAGVDAGVSDAGVPTDAGLDRCAGVVCTALDACHQVGVCDPQTGQCSQPVKEDGSDCDDGNACTRIDVCVSGTCVGGERVECIASDQCHSAGTCDPMTGACSNPVKANDTPCSDGNACTQTDTCQSGTCVGANLKTCIASDQCHSAGTCDPMTGACSNPVKANDTPCSDGNACTQTDTCQSGTCVGANPKTCIASDQCHTAGTCDPMTGACSNPAKADDTPCSDGNACTQTDTCQSGTCVGANPKTCIASDQCHSAGTCDPMTGACSNPVKADDTPCSDGNACTQTDTCQSGTCVGANPKTCIASDQCHSAGTCDPMTGACSNPAKANDTPCSDGNACTQTDTCQSGACVGANPKTCIASDQCHTAGTCDPMTGACSNPVKANDTPCSDGNACTQTDTCQSGTCVGANPKTCIASDQCHSAGTCDPMTGACSNPAKANDTPCSDGNACTQTDTCQSGTCVGANPKTCIASDQCHSAGTCDPMTGACSNPVKANNTPCSDGNACTQTDTCQSGTCVGANPVVCVAAGACNLPGVCNAQTGVCSDPAGPDGEFPGSQTTVCGVGACRRTGRTICSGGQIIDTCVAGTPAASDATCNNVDENCDGTRDEGYVSAPTTCGAGICAAQGSMVCQTGNVVDTCTPLCQPSGTFENPAPTCRNVLDTGGSQGDGFYYLKRPDGTPYLTYCNMSIDGGGWTSLFVGLNGHVNVFDHFDEGVYGGLFADPRTGRYLQRAPAALGDSAAELAVECGNAMVSFALTQPVLRWLVSGARAGWQPLTPRVLTGTVNAIPNSIFTGDPGVTSTSYGFIFARNNASLGNTFGSSYVGNTSFDFCNGVANTTSTLRVYYREVAATPVKNAPEMAAPSCRAILRAGQADGDGLYWLAQPGSPTYLAYCDMTTDGGGWTGVYAGRNGSTNVTDRFDSPTYQGACTDPATRCLRRAPASLADTSSELAVSCGSAMVAFTTTQAAQKWLVSGTRAGWIDLTPRMLAQSLSAVPNTLFTGASDNDMSFIFARNSASLGNTFASSYSNNTSFDYCANDPDRASMVRIFYRETDPTPELNTQATARTSCRAVLLANESQGDGLYWLSQGGGAPYLAYCDMTTDGGGWTAVFAGQNGSTNVFDHFDAAAHQGICTDPAARCVRRAPALLGDSTSELAVSCGPAMVAFAMTQAAQKWLVSGLASDWIDLTPRVLSGAVSFVPNTVYTGTASLRSFIFSRNRSSLGNTFASSHPNNAAYDYCANVLDQASRVRVFYREAEPTPTHNTPESTARSCRRILAADPGAQSGLYWLREPGGQAYQAYCDMTTDGGGWTAVFAGRNGSTNVFDHFDAPTYQGICTDPATHCLRRPPNTVGNSATELAVFCGDAAVSFALTQEAKEWLTAGTRRDFIKLSPTLLSGVFPNMPNTLFTGSSDANMSFIFSRNNSSLSNTFASSYSNNASFDYCANTLDAASLVRIAYREVAPTPVRNLESGARASCRAILAAGEAAGDGLYWLTREGQPAALTYCDMTTDGGGWTAIFAGRNGSTNVFDRFDTGVHQGTCTDPATRCLRRAPSTLPTTGAQLLATCGDAAATFDLPAGAREFLVNGTQANWVSLPNPRVLAGTFAATPNTMWTGGGSNGGFIVARNSSSLGNTFASSYPHSESYDYCANTLDRASLVRLLYREP